MSYGKWKCFLLAAVLLAGCEVSEEGPRLLAEESAPSSASALPARQPLFPATPSTTSQSEGSLPFVKGFEAGYERATTARKPMLIFFTAEWCHFCHQMADETFTNPQIVALADHFVCILVDADAEPHICKRFRVQGYPTVQFLSPRGVPLNRLVGRKPSRQLMAAMQAALDNVARKNDDVKVR